MPSPASPRATGSAPLLQTMKKAATVLRQAGLPFALAGGGAAYARGAAPPVHDVDFVLAETDAGAAAQALAASGMTVERPPEGWLIKAFDGDQMIDLIYCLGGVQVTSDLLSRVEELDVAAIRLPVLGATDLVLSWLHSFTEHYADFAATLTCVRPLREQVDWNLVRKETGQSAFARAFLVLLEGLGVIEAPVAPAGLDAVPGDDTPSHLAGRIERALGRNNSHGGGWNMISVAAVGDVHLAPDVRGTIRPHLTDIGACADVLLLAGDLTQHGTVEEAEVVAAEFGGLDVPVVTVLGNHDYQCDSQDEITGLLRSVGITVLEGSGIVLSVPGGRLGVAGTKGFGVGFRGRCGSEFGEPEMKEFVRHSRRLAESLDRALRGLDADFRVALTHYAPVADTLAGEPPEIYPFLGSYFLAEAIDSAGADLAVHGHAHAGQECGVTPGGTQVRNVALPVLRRAYALYCLGQPDPSLAQPDPSLA